MQSKEKGERRHGQDILLTQILMSKSRNRLWLKKKKTARRTVKDKKESRESKISAATLSFKEIVTVHRCCRVAKGMRTTVCWI